MRLDALLTACGLPVPAGAASVVVTDVVCDSRRVTPDALFVAVRGAAQDGAAFVPEAVRRGARAVVTESSAAVPAGVIAIHVADSRSAAAALAHGWYGHPASALAMVGVTGTNGKTTVAYLIQHLFQQHGDPCGLIGTIEYRAGGPPSPSSNTTPGPMALAALLAQMRRAGLRACAMEVSSHALDQQRVAGIPFRTAVFTNASPEHLDYHKTFEAYRAAKARLFDMIPASGTAVLNADDPSSSVMRRRTRARCLTFGVDHISDIQVQEARCDLDGASGLLATPRGRVPFRTTLVGRHNLSNVAAMAAVGIAHDVPPATIAEALETFPGVPGRLQRLEAGQPFPVFVDYAHTDEALRRVLLALLELTDARLLVVFGCGGDRDRTKRPRMGAVAGRHADRLFITSDNPRSESPQAIADAIVGGIAGPASYTVVLDRAAAIRQALQEATSRSVVLIAGKGHETTQITGDQIAAFDDAQVAREALAPRGAEPAVAR
ncbi:MAG: UDP-N-acetylmuramoyl-L-alanyl-D-glutamate--2,6-diaminopimelate ligase [Omnitrophica WOR_2 bacterium RIFCSPHIGHO2_02_FULL_68_15]|nr:MAG: UDP-N-acetylmuramoyl-L-alanyl-D-glutamate--2,6-diaminopimelate ligase [Omnitrophica WOR_2 bacterium RIFCSPHIGHO2_02_FULL_68_15]